jgi:hypothetical protein
MLQTGGSRVRDQMREISGLTRLWSLTEISNRKKKWARGSVVVKALGYKPEGRGFDTR